MSIERRKAASGRTRPSTPSPARSSGAISCAPTTGCPRSSSRLTTPRRSWSSPRAMRSAISRRLREERPGSEHRREPGRWTPPASVTALGRHSDEAGRCAPRTSRRSTTASARRRRPPSRRSRERPGSCDPGPRRRSASLTRSGSRPAPGEDRRSAPATGPSRRPGDVPRGADRALAALADEGQDLVDGRVGGELLGHVLRPARRACPRRRRAGGRRGAGRGSARGRSRGACRPTMLRPAR